MTDTEFSVYVAHTQPLKMSHILHFCFLWNPRYIVRILRVSLWVVNPILCFWFSSAQKGRRGPVVSAVWPSPFRARSFHSTPVATRERRIFQERFLWLSNGPSCVCTFLLNFNVSVRVVLFLSRLLRMLLQWRVDVFT